MRCVQVAERVSTHPKVTKCEPVFTGAHTEIAVPIHTTSLIQTPPWWSPDVWKHEFSNDTVRLHTRVLGIFVSWVEFRVTELALFAPTPPFNHTPTHFTSATLSYFLSTILALQLLNSRYINISRPPTESQWLQEHCKRTQWYFRMFTTGARRRSSSPWHTLSRWSKAAKVTCSVMGARLHPGVTAPPLVYRTDSKTFQMFFRGKFWPVRAGLDLTSSESWEVLTLWRMTWGRLSHTSYA